MRSCSAPLTHECGRVSRRHQQLHRQCGAVGCRGQPPDALLHQWVAQQLRKWRGRNRTCFQVCAHNISCIQAQSGGQLTCVPQHTAAGLLRCSSMSCTASVAAGGSGAAAPPTTSSSSRVPAQGAVHAPPSLSHLLLGASMHVQTQATSCTPVITCTQSFTAPSQPGCAARSSSSGGSACGEEGGRYCCGAAVTLARQATCTHCNQPTHLAPGGGSKPDEARSCEQQRPAVTVGGQADWVE